MRVPKSYMPGALGEISLKTASGRKITAAIEFLRTGVDGAGAQAFRFIQIEPADRRRLEDVLDHMRKHGLGEKQGAFRPLAYLTRFLG